MFTNFQTIHMKTAFKTIIVLAMIQLAFAGLANAQLTALPDGGNKRASVSEGIGITNVSIIYSRPAVKKRDGHIWGGPVHVGYADLGFGSSKAAPWRAGANENTIIEFSTNVTIE